MEVMVGMANILEALKWNEQTPEKGKKDQENHCVSQKKENGCGGCRSIVACLKGSRGFPSRGSESR